MQSFDMNEQSKSKAISERLVRDILSGKYEGKKFPSDRMLMRRFAVARATVQAAMKELMERQLVDRKPGRGTFLSDRARLTAARKFGIIMPDAYYSFYARISRGIEEAAKANGWTTLSAALGTGSLRDRAAKAVEFAELCRRERVGGIFLQPLQFFKDGERFNREILDVFKEADIPVVLLDSDFVEPPRRSEHDLVGIDNTAAGYELARHLIQQGARHIWYFSSPRPAPTSLKRGNGVGIAVCEAGLKWTREQIFFCDPSDARAARRVFSGKNRPDGIVAVNDYIASILVKTLRAIGKRVPDDVMLVGCNGDPISEEMDPPLTTAVQPCYEIGEAAVQLMLSRLRNPRILPRTMQFAVRLDVRESSARKPLHLSKRKRPS